MSSNDHIVSLVRNAAFRMERNGYQVDSVDQALADLENAAQLGVPFTVPTEFPRQTGLRRGYSCADVDALLQQVRQLPVRRPAPAAGTLLTSELLVVSLTAMPEPGMPVEILGNGRALGTVRWLDMTADDARHAFLRQRLPFVVSDPDGQALLRVDRHGEGNRLSWTLTDHRGANVGLIDYRPRGLLKSGWLYRLHSEGSVVASCDWPARSQLYSIADLDNARLAEIERQVLPSLPAAGSSVGASTAEQSRLTLRIYRMAPAPLRLLLLAMVLGPANIGPVAGDTDVAS